MSNKTRQLSEGALMVAMVAILLLINRQTANLLESSVYWILSFPIMIYRVKYSLKQSLIVFVSCMIISFILSVPTTMFYLFISLVVGITYGSGVQKGLDNKIILAITIFFELLSLFVTTILLSSIFGFDIGSEIKVFSETLNQFNGFSDTKNLAVMMVVIVYVGSSILEALCIHLLGHVLLKRLNLSVKPLKSLDEITYPKYVAYFIIVTLILLLLYQLKVIDSTYQNYIIGVYTIGFIIADSAGVIFALCYFKSKKSKLITFLVLLSAFIPPFCYIMFIIGLYDILNDKKKEIERK